MYDFTVSAPGKLFVCGEYAVLENAPAVITSVGRRIRASTVSQNMVQSHLLRYVKERVASFLAQRWNSPVGRLPNIDIDSRGFSMDNAKLGIGSSAAVATAATGALLEYSGLSIEENRSQVLDIARLAHLDYQQGHGSGGDVAAATLGGTIVFQRDSEPESLRKVAFHPVFVWSGNSASTTRLVTAVKRLKQEAPSVYEGVIDAMVETAREMAMAFRQCDEAAIVQLMARYGKQMGDLGKAASIPVMTRNLTTIMEMAAACGGAAKPSGAGGGDVAVAVFESDETSQMFRDKCRSVGLHILEFDAHVEGVRRDKGGDPQCPDFLKKS